MPITRAIRCTPAWIWAIRNDWRWAAAISAALFAAAHLELTFFIPAFVLGYIFAYLYQRSGSVWPGMIIHAAMNALAMAVLYLQL